MPRFSRSDIAVAALVATALGFGALGFAGFTDNLSNSLLFVAWSLTLLTLFVLAIRVPLRGGGSRLSAWVTSTLIASAAIIVVIAANIALFRHDAHFDVTQGGRNTPPKQLTDVIEHLRTPLSLTYFLNTGDANAIAMRDLITIAARSHPLLAFRAIDLDKEPGLARDNGVHSYNTAVLQAGDRKVLVENVTDPARLGYAVLRALRERPETICFITGHGETFRPTPDHFHYSHVETLRGHDTPGADDVLVAEPEQLDRFQLALNEIGFDMRGIITAAANSIPSDCAVVAVIGPRTAFAAGEADLLVKYLEAGGRLLLLIDPLFPVDPDFETRLLGAVGLSTEAAIVIDPLNHFRTDPDKVAVPYYNPHPITKRLALTVFPQVRPIRLVQPPARRQHHRAGGEQPGQLSTPALGRGRNVGRRRRGSDSEGRSWCPGPCGCARRCLAGSAARQALSPGGRRHKQDSPPTNIFPMFRMASCRSRWCAGLPRTMRRRTSRRRPTTCLKSCSPADRCAILSSRWKCFCP